MKKFKEFYEKKIKNADNVQTKDAELNVEKIRISLIDNDEIGTKIEIMSLRDPNIAGFVKYSTPEKAQIAYDNLNDLGSILNFMYYNMTNVDTAHKWSNLVASELRMEKKKTKEEIEKDGLNFSIKSDMEREAEMMALAAPPMA